MISERHRLALAVLQRLLVRGYVGGMRFGGIPQMLIDAPPDVRPLRGQVFINLGNAWTVFPARPALLPPTDWNARSDQTEDEELHALCALRFAEIVRVELGTNSPDLILSFADGRVFYMSGAHARYEAWDAGLAWGDPTESWHVRAMPGGELDVSAPDHFPASARAC